MMPVRGDAGARERLRVAHDQTYRFPPGFPGFSAEVTYEDGAGRAVGAMAIRTPRDILLEIDAGPEALAWLRKELGMMAGHRWPASFDEGDGRYQMAAADDPDDLRGSLIRLVDDPAGTAYRLREGRIVEVERAMGPARFVINVLEHVQTGDGRLLPTYFTVSFWSGVPARLAQTDAYTDRFTLVDGVVLPESRRVITIDDGGVSARQVTLSEHRMLPGA